MRKHAAALYCGHWVEENYDEIVSDAPMGNMMKPAAKLLIERMRNHRHSHDPGIVRQIDSTDKLLDILLRPFGNQVSFCPGDQRF
jgi:hypothetical protein